MAEGDFAVQVNVGAGVPIDLMMEDPSEGPHTVQVLDVREVRGGDDGSGKVTWRFAVTDTEPGSPTLGVQTQVVIGTDWSKPFNLGHLVNSLLSVGCHPDKIKGVIPLSPDVWRGRPAYIFVRPAPEGELTPQGRPARASKNFLTPEMYQAAKRAAALKAPKVATPAPQAGSVTSTAQPIPGAVTSTVQSQPPPQNAQPVTLKNLFS